MDVMSSRSAHVDFRADDGDGYVVPWYTSNPPQSTVQNNNGISAHPSYGLRTPTSSSSPTRSCEHLQMLFHSLHHPEASSPAAVPRPQATTAMVNQSHSHHTDGVGLVPGSQAEESVLDAAMFPRTYDTGLMAGGDYSSFPSDIFSANLDQAARHPGGDAFVNAWNLTPWDLDASARSDDPTFANAAAMHDAVSDDHASEAIAMRTCEEQLRRDSHDSSPYGPGDQALIVRQPLAMHGANSNQSRYVNQLHARAEQMVQSPLQYSADVANSFDQQDSPPEDMQHTFSQNSADLSQSPHSLADVQDVGLQTPSAPESRRPSAELVARIENVHLQNSQLGEDLATQHSVTFKKPSYSQQRSIAARRKQTGPHGINTQRPHGLGLNRVASSSAVVQMSTRNPTSPHHTLRRNKSSNVMYAGITKPGQSSNRASPRVSSFSEASTMSSQATPQPMNMGLHPQTSLVRPSMMSEYPADMGPPSASTATFTPGLHSGSMQGHSFQNTPVTTPSMYNHQHALYPSQPWPPASGVPQSAPAHMTTFPRDMSPQHGIPSMPMTPETGHFNQVQQQMSMYHGSTMHPVMVPSQHGPPEGFGLVPPHQHLFHQQTVDYPYSQEFLDRLHSERFLAESEYWANTHRPTQALEVKLDANMDKLQQDIRVSRTKLHDPIATDITFNNTTFHDMKIKADKN